MCDRPRDSVFDRPMCDSDVGPSNHHTMDHFPVNYQTGNKDVVWGENNEDYNRTLNLEKQLAIRKFPVLNLKEESKKLFQEYTLEQISTFCSNNEALLQTSCHHLYLLTEREWEQYDPSSKKIEFGVPGKQKLRDVYCFDNDISGRKFLLFDDQEYNSLDQPIKDYFIGTIGSSISSESKNEKILLVPVEKEIDSQELKITVDIVELERSAGENHKITHSPKNKSNSTLEIKEDDHVITNSAQEEDGRDYIGEIIDGRILNDDDDDDDDVISQDEEKKEQVIPFVSAQEPLKYVNNNRRSERVNKDKVFLDERRSILNKAKGKNTRSKLAASVDNSSSFLEETEIHDNNPKRKRAESFKKTGLSEVLKKLKKDRSIEELEKEAAKHERLRNQFLKEIEKKRLLENTPEPDAVPPVRAGRNNAPRKPKTAEENEEERIRVQVVARRVGISDSVKARTAPLELFAGLECEKGPQFNFAILEDGLYSMSMLVDKLREKLIQFYPNADYTNFQKIFSSDLIVGYNIKMLCNLFIPADTHNAEKMKEAASEVTNKSDIRNKFNISNFLTHFWFLVRAVEYNSTLDTESQFKANTIGLMKCQMYQAISERWLPYVSCGEDTLLTPSMQIHADKVKAGAGTCKTCPCCGLRYLSLSNGSIRNGHNITNCEALLNLHDNEFVMLEQINHLKKANAVLEVHDFLKISSAKTLLRPATEDEKDANEYVVCAFTHQPMRINRKVMFHGRKAAHENVLHRIEKYGNGNDDVKLGACRIVGLLDCYNLAVKEPHPNLRKNNQPRVFDLAENGFLYRSLINFKGENYSKYAATRDFENADKKTGLIDHFYFSKIVTEFTPSSHFVKLNMEMPVENNNNNNNNNHFNNNENNQCINFGSDFNNNNNNNSYYYDYSNDNNNNNIEIDNYNIDNSSFLNNPYNNNSYFNSNQCINNFESDYNNNGYYFNDNNNESNIVFDYTHSNNNNNDNQLVPLFDEATEVLATNKRIEEDKKNKKHQPQGRFINYHPDGSLDLSSQGDMQICEDPGEPGSFEEFSF